MRDDFLLSWLSEKRRSNTTPSREIPLRMPYLQRETYIDRDTKRGQGSLQQKKVKSLRVVDLLSKLVFLQWNQLITNFLMLKFNKA